MTKKHIINDTCNLKPYEAHLASICVAIVFGCLGGYFAKSMINDVNYWLYLLTGLAGFLFPYIICKYIFVTAHEWYGEKSLSHRVYDLIGIVSALLFIFII